MKITAVIVEDEPSGIKVLCNYLRDYCPEVEVVATADSIESGKSAICRFRPDLIFLDINFSRGTGFELLEQLPPFYREVIIVTAYNEYGIQAVKQDICDYLLKPVDIDELTRAVAKAYNRISQAQHTERNGFHPVSLPTQDGFEVVEATQIIRFQANGAYTWVYTATEEKPILVSKNIGYFEENLIKLGFIRIHRSHLINPTFVKRYSHKNGGNILLKDGTALEVAAERKKELFRFFR